MIFKIVFNNEIHRVRAKVSSLEDLLEAISARLPNLDKSSICCDYKDLDGDHVRINCQEDFTIMQEEFEGKKSVKIFVKEDPNQTLQLSTQVSTDAVVIEAEPTVVEVKEPETKPIEHVMMTLVLPEDREVKPEPVKVEDEISIEKPVQTEEAEPEKPEEKDFKDWVAWKKMWCKGPHGAKHHGKHHKKHWEHKKRWWREKFNKKFDEAIQRALPQIAVHVAQILRNGGESVPVEACAPMQQSETMTNQDKVVHHGYICDGCGMSPIVGVCYKSAVVKDFDFCEKCEATIPHPHPFLKLKTPEQRPHAMLMVVNEEGKPPFDPKKHMPELKKSAMGLLGQMFSHDWAGEKKPENVTPSFEEAFKNLSKFVDPEQLKQFGVDPKVFAEMMSKKGNKCGQKNFCKMMKQGQKFFHKFMKSAHKGKGVPPMFAGFFDQFKGKGGGCPFKNFKEAMKKNCAKKPETPVEAMTYDEQLAHAMKLSMANTEEPEEPKVPEKKETKKVETPKTTLTTETETPRAPSEMSFEEQLAAAMKLSLEEANEKKPAKLEDDVVIMNESEGTDSVDTETLYDSDAETTKPQPEEPKKEEKPKPVVKVEEVDPVVLANTAQLMAICGVPEDREMDVRKWVEAKAKSGNTGINELLNLFLDEMAGRF